VRRRTQVGPVLKRYGLSVDSDITIDEAVLLLAIARSPQHGHTSHNSGLSHNSSGHHNSSQHARRSSVGGSSAAGVGASAPQQQHQPHNSSGDTSRHA
jgi:hypothetical protein